MDLLISDRGEAEISNRVKDILRMYAIEDFQSEPHHMFGDNQSVVTSSTIPHSPLTKMKND